MSDQVPDELRPARLRRTISLLKERYFDCRVGVELDADGSADV